MTTIFIGQGGIVIDIHGCCSAFFKVFVAVFPSFTIFKVKYSLILGFDYNFCMLFLPITSSGVYFLNKHAIGFPPHHVTKPVSSSTCSRHVCTKLCPDSYDFHFQMNPMKCLEWYEFISDSLVHFSNWIKTHGDLLY